MNTWKELISQSEIHNKFSKPESLAIIEIMSDSGIPLSTSQIHEKFKENYQNDITRRQISYCIELMEENHLMENVSANNKEKQYSLIDIKETWRNPTTKPQATILIISVVIFLIHKSDITFGVLIGMLSFIIMIQIEYEFFIRRKQKYLR